jgi:hypothetical protein
MVLSRLGFGYRGNALPAGLNALVAGIGWFAVNSVSGAFALNVLTHWPKVGCLLIIVVVQVVVAHAALATGQPTESPTRLNASSQLRHLPGLSADCRHEQARHPRQRLPATRNSPPMISSKTPV